MVRKCALVYTRWLEWLDRWLLPTWWLLLLGAIYIAWEVIMRYFFNSPHTWFDETFVPLCLFGLFFGCGYTTLARSHITLGVLYTRFKVGMRRIADIIIYAAMIIVSVLLIIFCFQWASYLNSHHYTTESVLNTPKSLVIYPIIIGYALNAIYALGMLLKAWAGIGYEKAAEREEEAFAL